MENINQAYLGKRLEILQFVPPNIKRALDVGCSTGDFGDMLKKSRSSIEVHGIEMNPASAEVAKNRLDKVLVGDVMGLISQLPDHYYDLISFNDVLEHMEDPYSVVRALKAKLSENGVLISSIPNVRHYKNLINLLWHKDWQYQDFGILDRTHLRFFTEKTVQKLFTENGFEILHFTGINKTKSIRPALLNLITFGAFGNDTRFLQFLTIAKPLRA